MHTPLYWIPNNPDTGLFDTKKAMASFAQFFVEWRITTMLLSGTLKIYDGEGPTIFIANLNACCSFNKHKYLSRKFLLQNWNALGSWGSHNPMLAFVVL